MKRVDRIGENTEIFIDYYYNASAEDKLHYTDEMKEKIKAADAIILAYMGSGLGIDPTEKLNNTGMAAVNANIIAAVETIFGCNRPTGKVPVNIPMVEEDAGGNLSYGTKILYERGFGLVYP